MLNADPFCPIENVRYVPTFLQSLKFTNQSRKNYSSYKTKHSTRPSKLRMRTKKTHPLKTLSTIHSDFHSAGTVNQFPFGSTNSMVSAKSMAARLPATWYILGGKISKNISVS